MAQAKMDFIVNTRVDKTAFVELKREIQALRGLTEKDLINFGSASNFQEAKKQLTAIQNSATTVETALNKAFSPKLGTVSLTKFNNELKKIDLQGLANNFSKAGAAGAAAFRSLTTNVLTTKIQIKETHKLLDDMGKTMSNTIKWGLSSSAWNTMTGSFQKAYSYVKNLDKSLNNIRIVSEKSADDMARFAVQANKAAKALGSTTLDYTDAALIYYQQGLSEEEVAKRTNTTVKMANALGASAEDVSDYMTAIWNNFDDGSKSIEYYADVITKLGAATASSAEEISTGLEKFAAIADTVGLSYEYATAALTTVTATTRQSAEVVGTAFKTLFARIQDLELGNTLDDGVTLGKYSEALQAVGITVKESNGNLRDMDDILKDMGSKWDTLTKAQQVSLAQTVAGTRQYTQLVALMDNWDFFQENLSTAANATGELNKQQEIYLESTQAHLDQLSTSAERLYSNLVDSEGLNDLIDVFSTMVTGVAEYTEAIGGSKSVLLQLGNLATKAFGRTLSQSIATSVTNLQKLKEQAEDFNAQAAIIKQFKGIKVDDTSFTKLVNMAQAVHDYKDTLSEAQIEEANAIMTGYNEAVNARDMWQEAKTYAENYYSFFTGQQTGSLDQSFSDSQLDTYFTQLDNKVLEYEKKLGSAKVEINKMLETYEAETIDAYIDSAYQMLENKLIKNEQLETKLKAILEKYKNAGLADSPGVLSEEQVDALQDFGDTYGKIADDILKDTKKVKDTFKDAQKGMSDAQETAIDEMNSNWDSFINKINVQSITQNFIDMGGQIMSIASAMQSLGNIPRIWENEDLSTGEKLLQTVIALTNAGRGLASTYELIHTTATLITAAQAKNVAGEIAEGKAIAETTKKQDEQTAAFKRTNEKIGREIKAVKRVQKEIQNKTNLIKEEKVISADASTKEISDETRYAAQVMLSVEAILAKNKALGKGPDKVDSNYIFGVINEAMQQQIAKEQIEDYLATKGFKGTYSQIPTMSADNLKRMTKDQGKAERLARTFKGISGQGHAIARGEKPDGFTIKNEKGVNELVEFLNQLNVVKNKAPEATEKVKDVAKHTKAAKEGVEALGAAGGAGKTGGALTTLKADFATIGKAIAAIPPMAWVAVAAIAAIGVAIWAAYEAATKEQDQINALRQASKDLQNEYNDLKSTIDSLQSSFDGYTSALTTLRSCTKGTKEWDEALLKVNTSVLEILKQFPELAKMEGVFTRIGGVLQLNSEVVDEYLETLQNRALILQTASITAMATADSRQAALDKKKDLEKIGAGIYSQHTNPYLGTAPNAGNVMANQESITRNYKIIKDNYDSLAKLTKSEMESKLRSLGVEEQYIESVTKHQDAIDKNIEAAEKAAIQMENIATQIANIVIGDTSGADNANTQLTLAKIAADDLAETYTKKWLDSVTGSGISKASGGQNEKYLAMLEELKKSGVYSNIEAVRNGVQGTDNNRELVFRVTTADGETKEITQSAAAWAAIAGTSQATRELQEKDYDAEADKILEPIAEKLDGDKALADRLVEAITSKDYSGLSQEDITTIKAAYENSQMNGLLSDQQAKDLGLKNGAAFTKGIGTAIEQWDEDAYKKTLKQKLDNLYATSADAVGITEEALRILADGIKENAKEFDNSEEDIVELAKVSVKFQKTLQELGESLNDNKDLLKAWAKSSKSAADLGLDTVEAVGALKKGLKDLLNLDVDEAFLKENFETIQKAIQGDVNALDQLEIAAGKQYIINLEVDGIEDLYNQYNDVFEDLANTDLEIGAHFNDEEALADLQNFFATAKLSQADAQAVLDKYGYEGELEKVTVPGVKMNKIEYEWVPEQTTVTQPSYPALVYNPTSKAGYDKVQVPSTQIPVTRMKQVAKTVDASTPDTYFYVLKSKNGKSTNGNIQTSGLSGSVKSKGTGAARASAVKAGVGRPSVGGSSAKPKVEERFKDEKDIYHDVNVSLKQIANKLSEVQQEQETLVGDNLIENLAEQYALLNKQLDKTAEKMKIAEGEAAELAKTLSGKGIKFNKDGTISNYASAYDAQLAKLNSIIDTYNSKSEKQQEQYQKTLDDAKEAWEEFLADIERYDTILTDEIPGMEADMFAAVMSQIELKLTAFHQEIEIRLDMAEAERDWNAFFNKVIKDIDEEDILGNAEAKLEDFFSYYKDEMKGVIQVNTQHVQDILADLKAMDKDVAGQFYSKDGVDNRAKALEDLKTYYEQLMSDLEAVHDLSDEIHESYVEMIDEAQEKFDEQISTFETLNSLIEHDKNMISMVYGEESYTALAQFYDKQEENYNKQLDFQKQQVDFWQKQMELAEEGSDAWEAAKENWVSAVETWNASIESAIQNLQDKYLNAINAIFQALNNKVTGGMGLGYVETEWDLINKNADQYLDTVNAIYKVQELQNKYLDAIEKSSNPAQQKKLNDLMQQETDYLREQDKLSEYDLERANLKYEIALKQMALEEAQNNKSKLRLRRDSQGNYTYQYTQDEDQIATLQSEIADLYNQLYNLDANAYKGNLDEIYSIWQEFQTQMAEAAQINDPEQRAAKELLIKQQYGELINGLVEKNELLQANMYQSTMSHLFDLYNQNTANYEDMSEEQRAILDQFINTETDLNNAAFDNLFNLYNVNIEQFKDMTEQQKDILMNSILPQWNSGVQQMVDTIAGEGGFTAVCKEAFEELDQATQDYTTGLEELQESAKVSFEEVKEGIDNVIVDTEKLLENNSELIEQYDKEIDAIRSVIDELNALIEKYKDAEAAAKAASEEAYRYWQEEQNRNASADNKIDTPVEEDTSNTNITPVNPTPAEPAKPSLNTGSYIEVKSGTRWYADSYGGGNSGPARSGKISYINLKGSHPYNIGGLGWIRKSDIVGYDTGGYTGDWNSSDGRLAMLHKKELVLNAHDTDNMLSAITIMRDLTANLGATLLNKMASITSGNIGVIGQGIPGTGLEQSVIINAEFPNATSAREIEDAINNLVNRASQHITK